MTGQLQSLPVPFGTMFPRMRYFEIQSKKAGARYAVWVTTPAAYDKKPGQRFAAIYMPDGNWNAPTSAELADLSDWDLIDSFQPTIQICVGYAGEDVGRSIAVRARDLLPPNEPFTTGTESGVKADIEAGLIDRPTADLYLQHLKNPAGDRFLAFLVEELHPLLLSQYRIDPGNVGLFGHSYGGLFATYAALQKTTIFRNIGASSPGILPVHSSVFEAYAQAQASGGIEPRNLHMSVGTREVTTPGIYQDLVGAGTVEFMGLVGSKPLKGLAFTSQLFELETHMTVKPPAVHAFLRKFYLRNS